MDTRDQVSSANSAAHHLTERVPRVGPEETVAAVIDALVGARLDSADTVYVTDHEDRLLGLVPVTDLLRADHARRLRDIMVPDPRAVLPDEDQESIATVAVTHGLSSVPVVDPSRRLLGVVPALALIGILRREHVEDLHRLAGMRGRSEQAHLAFRGSPLHRLRLRLPWLLVGLLGSMIATFVMSRFAGVLEAMVVIAFFVPGIVYLADAVGTQTEAIAVRGLSFGETRFLDVFSREVATGLLIGAALAAFAFPAVWFGFGDPRLATAVAAAILAAGTVATAIGLALPWIFARAGRDPAFGSGPVATVIQDVLSILIYFGCVRLLLG